MHIVSPAALANNVCCCNVKQQCLLLPWSTAMPLTAMAMLLAALASCNAGTLENIDTWQQPTLSRPQDVTLLRLRVLGAAQASGVIDEYLATHPSQKSKDTSAGTACVIQ